MRFLIYIRDVLWGLPTVAVVSAFGLYFTLKLGFFRPSRLKEVFAKTFFAPRKKGTGGDLSSLAALSTALGGTVGVGSISGVALAISLGGAGSIFWMWVCSFLGIGLKYAEIVIAHKLRVRTKRGFTGGAMYCLRAIGKGRLAVVFALLTVISAAAGGSVVQAGAFADAVQTAVDERLLCAVITAFSVLAVISGGRKYIAGFNTVALPLASVSFAFLCLAVLVSNASALPKAFSRIFEEALGVRPALGGIGLTAMLRVGCTRGTFSTEAGMGSSPMSYCAAGEDDPHVQGLWGATEVIIDSFVVSTLTALCVLCTGEKSVLGVFDACFGGAGRVFYFAAVSVFAFAAIISWCFYGEEAMYFLLPNGKKAAAVFKIAVAAGAFAGALLPEGGAFAAADVWGALMLAPNLYLLYKTRSDIIELAKQKR